MGKNLVQLAQKVSNFRKLTPTFARCLCPKIDLRLFRDSNLDSFITRRRKSQLGIDWTVHYVRKLNRLIATLSEQLKHRSISKWTNLVNNLRASRLIERFNLIHLLGGYRLKGPESKRLRQRRANPIEHRERSCHFDPCRTPIGKRDRPRFDKINVTLRLGTFQTPRQFNIRKRISLIHFIRNRLSEPQIIATHHSPRACELHALRNQSLNRPPDPSRCSKRVLHQLLPPPKHTDSSPPRRRQLSHQQSHIRRCGVRSVSRHPVAKIGSAH